MLTLLAAACGSDGSTDGEGVTQEDLQEAIDAANQAQEDAAAAQAAADQAIQDAQDAAADSGGEPAVPEDQPASIIRFSFAPDPVWDYLTDTGTLAAWEEANNIRIVTSTTWDEFTYFAGGHGDIVSMGTQEIPVLEATTSIETVTFGKYNFQRSPMMKRAGDPYETLADVPLGSNICVSSPVSNTGFWTVAAQQLHDLDYRVGGGDFNLLVNDHFVNPGNLLRGDCEVAVIIPEAAAPQLRSGEIELMYDGQMPFQLYNQFSPIDDGENHVMSNLFTATAGWYEEHAAEAQAFLELWQIGIELWDANTAEIVSIYPQHFSVESEEDIAWMTEFMQGANDWFVESVYLDDAWIENERAIWDFMTGLHPENPNVLPEGFTQPRFEAIAP
jgi:hypothetical protein